ncbi:MAG: mismatch-specific DNA-glycosylase [Solirubrobacterales bacterium]
MRIVIVGSAKSIASATAGHYYAHRSNRFWHLLQATGLTGGRFIPHTEDRSVLRFGVGLTDVVPARAESNDSNLTTGDFDIPGFVGKMEKLEPAVIAFNGGTSASQVSRFLGHGAMAIGHGDWTLGGAATWRLPSSSSRNAAGGFAAKEAHWAAFGEWAKIRVNQVGED